MFFCSNLWFYHNFFPQHRPSLSYQRLQTIPVLNEAELLEKIKKTVSNNHEYMVRIIFHVMTLVNIQY